MEVDQQIRRHLEMIHDPVVRRFVNDLGLVLADSIGPQPFIYRFRIVENPTLNAFATTGGYIYLHTGLLLAASSVDELAGVVAHEIAHIRRHHYARLRKRSQLPDLAISAIALGAAIAAGEPAILFGVSGANVALKLKFSRELEAEADEASSVYLARAGFDPLGSLQFFERLLEDRDPRAGEIPPYLFSHPALEERIAARRLAGEGLERLGSLDPSFETRFREMKGRVAWLIANRRDHLPPSSVDFEMGDIALAQAAERMRQGEPTAAARVLSDALQAQPNDPRLSYELGVLRLEEGNHVAAVDLLLRTADLDPTRAAVLYRLGLAYKGLGDRQRAAHAMEEVVRLAGTRPGVGQRASWELAKLEFGVLAESGFADGSEGPGIDTPAGFARDQFAGSVDQMAWWGRVTPRFLDHAREIEIRWIDPQGEIVQEQVERPTGRVYLTSRLERTDRRALAPGEWTVEATFEGEVVIRDHVVVLDRLGDG